MWYVTRYIGQQRSKRRSNLPCGAWTSWTSLVQWKTMENADQLGKLFGQKPKALSGYFEKLSDQPHSYHACQWSRTRSCIVPCNQSDIQGISLKRRCSEAYGTCPTRPRRHLQVAVRNTDRTFCPFTSSLFWQRYAVLLMAKANEHRSSNCHWRACEGILAQSWQIGLWMFVGPVDWWLLYFADLCCAWQPSGKHCCGCRTQSRRWPRTISQDAQIFTEILDMASTSSTVCPSLFCVCQRPL